MYAQHPTQIDKDGLGFEAGAVATQIGTAVGGKVASMGASYLATAAGMGSAAGPIGAVVGALVGLFASLFGGGPKPKKPVFGLALIVNRPPNEVPSTENLINAGRHFVEISGNIPGPKDWGLPGPKGGTIGMTSGGVKPAHAALANATQQILAKQIELFSPFYEIFDPLPADLKRRIGREPVPWNRSEASVAWGKNAYYWTGSLPPGYSAWVLSDSRTIDGAADIGYTLIARHLGDILQRYSVDIEKALRGQYVDVGLFNIPNILGTWNYNGQPTVNSISPDGDIVLTNEKGASVSGYFIDSLTIMTAWAGGLKGTISPDLRTISFANNTSWSRDTLPANPILYVRAIAPQPSGAPQTTQDIIQAITNPSNPLFWVVLGGAFLLLRR